MSIESTRAESEAQLRRAIELHRQGLLSEARAHYETALHLEPHHPRALRLLGGLLLQSNQPELTVQLLSGPVDDGVADPLLYLLYASAHLGIKQYQAAVAAFDRAIALKWDLPDAHLGRGNALLELHEHESAIASYDNALAIDVGNPGAWNNRGIALFDGRRYSAAIESYDKAIALKPDYADAYYNRGNSLRELKELEAAVASYDRAISFDSGHLKAYLNRGTTLLDLQRYDAAIDCYNRAIAINPCNAQAHNNRGVALDKRRLHEAALVEFDRAIALEAGFGDAYYNRGNALRALKRHELAAENYGRAIALNAQSKGLLGLRLLAKTQICDWSRLAEEVADLTEAIERGDPASDPFIVMSLSGCAQLQRKAAETWVGTHYKLGDAPRAIVKRPSRGKIRVGYFSADFRNHAVAILSAKLFESHDRSAFEVIGFSLGSNTKDETRMRLEQGFDQFIDLEFKSDSEGARLSRNMAIDIAVDLGGFTADARPGVFARRPAPLQVSYLGYPGTTGASYLDYLIADRVLIPETDKCHYKEKIIYLPHSYQINDPTRRIAETVPARAELCLPPDAFIFCCFNNSNKIMPDCFDGWMRVLKRVEGSVLWLLEDNERASANLRREAAVRGVDAERLIFAGRVPPPEHLARHRCADLMLDTLPYNAHTTASDALWMGVPVLTRVGKAFAGRVAASLLAAIDLPELITTTQTQYEDLAVELAVNPLRLGGIRGRLRENRLITPLFDAALTAKHIETAFRTIYDRYQANLPPEHIYIGAAGYSGAAGEDESPAPERSDCASAHPPVHTGLAADVRR